MKQGVSSRDNDLALAGNAGRELEKARHESIEKRRRNPDRRLTREGNEDLAARAVCRKALRIAPSVHNQYAQVAQNIFG